MGWKTTAGNSRRLPDWRCSTDICPEGLGKARKL